MCYEKNKKGWMTKAFILSSMLFTCLKGFGTVWTITNSASTFVPSAITITLADSVNFDLSPAHIVFEVSQTTWNANDTTPLPGGFQTAFGGGLVDSSQLQEGVHYYVCKPHAAGGMKGIITVQHHAGVSENTFPGFVFVYPNPVTDILNISISDATIENCSLKLIDITGREYYTSEFRMGAGESKFPIPIKSNNLSSGIYFLLLVSKDGATSKKINIQ